MDLQHFVENFSQDPNLGRAIALYIIQPIHLAPTFQGRNYFRAGVAGSRETQNIDRSVTPSGAESRASSLYSRAAMYFANWIAGGTIVAALVLPPSVVNTPSGPQLTRILEKRNPDDARPEYALRGKTMAVALETIMHQEMDDMPRVKRARTDRVEWFQSTQGDLANAKLAMQAEDVTEEDGSVRLTLDDIADIRQNTTRGQQLLELITRPPKKKTSTTQTNTNTLVTRSQARAQSQPPITVRLTRSRVNQLRQAAETPDQELKRRKLARVLAELAT